MTLAEYLDRLIFFLNGNRNIWEREVIQNSHNDVEVFNNSFVNSLIEFRDEELFNFVSTLDSTLKNKPDYLSNLDNLIHEFDTKITLPYSAISESILPIQSNQNIKDKKRHELSNIYNFLSLKEKIPSIDLVIDYCGGAGYLSRNLAYYYSTKCLSIDIDNNLQERGIKRSKNFIPEEACSFTLEQLDIKKHANDISILPEFAPSIAIHSCGDLLDSAILNSIKRKASWILGIGCCYYKTENPIYNSSNFFKKYDFKFTQESLVLASSGNNYCFSNFTHSLKVKRYRYLLHILLNKHFGLEFISVGNCQKREYYDSFFNYAYNRLSHLYGEDKAIELQALIKEVSESVEYHKQVEIMIRKNCIRSKFSRLLEILIAIDRVLFLKENNYQTEIYQIFSPSLSPRNIAIYAER